jgi:hypothetical protein
MHQQEQLRGFEKNSAKLVENLEIMNGWLADSQALIKALSQ